MHITTFTLFPLLVQENKFSTGLELYPNSLYCSSLFSLVLTNLPYKLKLYVLKKETSIAPRIYLALDVHPPYIYVFLDVILGPLKFGETTLFSLV